MKKRTRQRHDAKAKLARHLRTPAEEKEGVSLFDSAGWIARANARARRAGLPANRTRQRYNTPVVEYHKANREDAAKQGGWLRGIKNRILSTPIP